MECIFCGESRKSSTEHVIPKWVGTVLLKLPATGVNPGGRLMTHRFAPAEGNDTPAREWESDGPSLTTNAVCIQCNNGWLGELEALSAPLVGSLILGEPTDLTTQQQSMIAFWSYKTVLLLQMIRSKMDRPIPARRFRELYELGRPPSDVRVWLGSPSGHHAMHETSTEIRLATNQIAVPGFFTALALGRLLILCAGRLRTGIEQIRIGHDANPRITTEVWPASLRIRRWPPFEALTDLHAKALVPLL
jgi:hypothetical protein